MRVCTQCRYVCVYIDACMHPCMYMYICNLCTDPLTTTMDPVHSKCLPGYPARAAARPWLGGLRGQRRHTASEARRYVSAHVSRGSSLWFGAYGFVFLGAWHEYICINMHMVVAKDIHRVQACIYRSGCVGSCVLHVLAHARVLVYQWPRCMCTRVLVGIYI